MENGGSPGRERSEQKSYWTEHTAEATVEAMMLDSQASVIDKEERPEVLGMLGSVSGARVVELGAGIGRFTGSLADKAASVLAIDFMAHLIEENRKINGGRSNVDWRAADVTELQLPAGSCDVLFSNWLLMYFSDAEVSKLAVNALQWVSDGGLFFFRESCFRQSGDKQRKSNPTHYRNPREYFQIFDDAEIEVGDGRWAHFELVSCRCVDTYVRLKRNQNQVCWKWRKVVTDAPVPTFFRQFLDTRQYTTTSILRYERVFGSEGCVSTGGLESTKALVSKLGLQPDERVLDAGCGVGGSSFYMAQTHGVAVHGVDLSVNMILIALERAAAVNGAGLVSFEIADVTKFEQRLGSFDAVFSRDMLLHIKDKASLFRSFYRLLKPGGRILVSDVTRGPAPASESFQGYITQRGYRLASLAEYENLARQAGFVTVASEDRTDQYEANLKQELSSAESEKESFVRDFSLEDYELICKGWKDKLSWVNNKQLRWGTLSATKPASEAVEP